MANIRDDRSTGVLGQCVLELGALGPVRLAWTAAGLRALTFGAGEPLDDVRLYQRAPSAYGRMLKEYARGRPVELAKIPVDPQGTRFQREVWAALREIPRGQVRSYGGVASDIGNPRASRAIGMANARNPVPIVIPCHRVVGAGHSLGGYSGGLARKRLLLELEGVILDGDQVRPGQLALF